MKTTKVFLFLLLSCILLGGCGRIGGKYTTESLAAQIGSLEKYSSREFRIGNEKCLDIWFAGTKTNDDLYYDECNYYIFKSKSSAGKAFNYIKKNWIDRETDSGTDFVQGWENADDASVELYIHLSENMIITAYVQVISEWGLPVEDDGGTSHSPSRTYQERIDFIKKNF